VRGTKAKNVPAAKGKRCLNRHGIRMPRSMDPYEVHEHQMREGIALKFRIPRSKIEILWTGTSLIITIDQHNRPPYRRVNVIVALDMNRTPCAAARIAMEVFGMSGSIHSTYVGPRGGMRYCRECGRSHG